MDGGGHERGLRSGTLNVPGIVGFATAVSIAVDEMEIEGQRTALLRDRLRDGLFELVPGVRLNGHPTRRLPGNLNVSVSGRTGADLASALCDVAYSGGSACSSGAAAPSHVLKSIGLDDEAAASAFRFGIGRFNTSEEIDYALGRIREMVARI
jgi:cysteine desulfurase